MLDVRIIGDPFDPHFQKVVETVKEMHDDHLLEVAGTRNQSERYSVYATTVSSGRAREIKKKLIGDEL